MALVTGGSRGIGRALALRLARDGHDVAFCYRQDEVAAAETRQALLSTGRRVYARACDVGAFVSVQEFLREAEQALGALEVVVNCAGVVRDNPLVLMSPEAWDGVLATNLTGVFNVCRGAVFSLMKQRRGCVINVSSVAGVYGNATQTNYCAAKAGIIGFSKALAKEVGAYGVRVNVVAPGYITTDMTAGLAPALTQRLLGRIALGRLGAADDVAAAVSFLASDGARYITGQTLLVDGGIAL